MLNAAFRCCKGLPGEAQRAGDRRIDDAAACLDHIPCGKCCRRWLAMTIAFLPKTGLTPVIANSKSRRIGRAPLCLRYLSAKSNTPITVAGNPSSTSRMAFCAAAASWRSISEATRKCAAISSRRADSARRGRA